MNPALSKPAAPPARRAAFARPRTPKSASRSRAWLIVPMALAGLLVAVLIVFLVRSESPHNVSEVTWNIRDIVLQRSDRPGVEDGGAFGPLWISAREADPTTGKLTDVRIRAGHVRLAARTGQIVVDSQDNTISFALESIVFMRVPMDAGSSAGGETISELESYVIGPVPYRRRIIEDGHPAGGRSIPEHMAGVSID